MSIVETLINVIVHLDKYLNVILQNYGIWTYVIIFLIIFCETGLVVTPFLPGDSILFAAGALAAMGSLNIFSLFIIFYIAAVVGDTINYYVGKKIGNKILEKEDIKYINKEYLNKAHRFYDKNGSMTIVLGRFIPIIRTFVPFVAGIGEMNYSKFIIYNMIGGFVWVSIFLCGGFFFGNLPFIKHNFSYVVIAIIIISLIPVVVTFIKEKEMEVTTKMMSLIQKLDNYILYAIKKYVQNKYLDILMTIITAMGNLGLIWIIIAVALLLDKPYRLIGYIVIFTLVVSTIVGEGIIKHIVRRVRPCNQQNNVSLLIRKPISYSFPSGHTVSSFAVAEVLSMYFTQYKLTFIAIAFLIALSRVYLYVHYPSDIIAGIIVGILCSRVIFIVL